ncbi:MAG: hypothetical protein HUU01_23225 [Saprospiraceae bacterium]|nr:hypothetical protein [Saprospiraceae bacterium]
MHKSTYIGYFLLLMVSCSSCIMEIELDTNPLDDPNFPFVVFGNVESTYLGPAYRDLKVNFSLRMDALTQQQRSKITSLRVYENGIARINISNLEQRFFIRKDREVGSTLVWEVVLVTGDAEGPRHPINSLSYYVD